MPKVPKVTKVTKVEAALRAGYLFRSKRYRAFGAPKL